MTPPCARCHGAPYTSPLPEGWERSGSGSPRCSVESRWSGSSLAAPEPQALESWVRSNFERAREEPRPFRVDLDEARLRADVRLRPQVRQFAPWPWRHSPYHAVAVNTAGMRVRADWEFADNALMLGLRELVSIQDLAVDGPLSANAWPQSLRVGNFGQLHFITRTTPSVLFLFDPFMVPRPPIGQDFPTAQQWEACEARIAAAGLDAGLENCAAPVVYPNHRSDPRIDLVITRQVPAEFLETDGRLPTAYNLEELWSNFQNWQRNHPRDPNAPRRDLLALVEEWLSPGSQVELDIARLNDFFLPGVLDLGPSRGRVRLSYEGGRLFSAVAEDFEIQLDPSGYPASANGEASPVEIQTAYLSSAAAPYRFDNGEIAPGLRLDFDAARGELAIEGNLSLHSDLRIPGWGQVELSGELALRSAWRIENGEWQPIPGTTHLEWRNGELWQAGGRPLLTRFNLDVGDAYDPLDPLAEDPQGLRAQIRGFLGQGGWLNADLHLPLVRDSRNHYDFESLLQEPARLALQFFVRQGEGEGAIAIEDGQAQVELQREADGRFDMSLDLNADRFAAFGLDLRGLTAGFRAERLRYLDGTLEARIPNFQVEVNPTGSRRGLLRGHSVVELLHPRDDATFVAYNFPARHLTLSDLDLRLSVQGISPSSLRSDLAHRILNPRVAGLGIDGHLQGSLNADFLHWRARGPIRLRGDRDGDVYFLDAAGRRVGPALVRDTRWSFSRVDRVDWRRRYALGRFHLDTLLNFSSLLPTSEIAEVAPVYGAGGQRLRPFEINGIMPYDNQPWDLRGFRNRILDYLSTLCRREPHCREELR